jgi:hypothetical protein
MEPKIFEDIKQYMRYMLNYNGELICRNNKMYNSNNELIAIFKK